MYNFTMEKVNSIPPGKPTLSKEDINKGKFSQVQQFVIAVLTHLKLQQCDRDLGTLFAKDLYHLGSNAEIKDMRSIFRGHCNQLLARIYMSELVINEPHLLLTPQQVEFICCSYQTFKNNSKLIEEARKKDFARQCFTDPKDITALELYILDFANEIGKYARYRFAALRQAASRLFGKTTPEEYCNYVNKAMVYKSRLENLGSILRSGPNIIPKRTKDTLELFFTSYCGVMTSLDKVVDYLDNYDSYFWQDDTLEALQ